MIKYCVNCEEPITEPEGLHDSHDNSNEAKPKFNSSDFCSQKCADEYIANCDPAIVERESKANQDMPIPIDSHLSLIGGAKHSTLDSANVITNSLLQLSGISKEDINKAINIAGTNSKELTQKSEADVNDKPFNE